MNDILGEYNNMSKQISTDYDFLGNSITGIPVGVSDSDAVNVQQLNSEVDNKEDSLGNPSLDGYVLASTISGTRSWVTAGITTNLSEGTATETSVDVNSSNGTNATLNVASTSRAGVMSSAKFDEVEVNTAKVGLTDGNKGDIVVSSTGTVLTIDSEAVTFAKTQNIATNKLLGRGSAGTGSIEEITLGTNLSLTGNTLNATGFSGGGTASPMSVMVLTSTVDTATFGINSPLTVPWDSEKYKDTGFSHSNSLNPTRAIVDNNGTYLIQGRLRIENTVNQRAQPTVNILKNGSLLQGSVDSSYIRNATGASDYWNLNFAYEPQKLVATDFIEIQLTLEVDSPTNFTSSTLIGSESSLSITNLQGTKGDQGIQGVAGTNGTNGTNGTDTDAVHINVSNEIAQITAKTTLHDDDVLIIEDSEDSNNKKSITIGNLPNSLVVPRVTSVTSTATLAIDSSITDDYRLTALATNLTINAPTSPTDGQKLFIEITDNGTSRSLTWDSIFRVVGTILPTSTTTSKLIVVGVKYDAAAVKWNVLAVAQEE